MQLYKMADNWNFFTGWQNVLPPSRPAAWQIDIIKEYVQNSHCKSAAILGSTIEFRDLLAECSIKNIYVFDSNADFYKYISKFRKYSNKEKLILGNWLDTIGDFESYFDIVLSDLTSGNIPYESREKFYHLISKSLSKNGVFIDRILTFSVPLIPLYALIEKYKKLPINKTTVNNFNCEVLFCSTLLDNGKKIVDTNSFYDYLCKLNIPQITKFVHSCYDITPRNCIWYYKIDWEDERKMYEKTLSIFESYDEPNQSSYYNRAKLFISRKRMKK